MEAIYAVDSKGGLGKNGSIPWNSKKDLQFFYQKTKSNVVIMGKNTFLSLPEHIRPLKSRLNIVLTSDPLNSIFDQYKNLNNIIITSNDKIYNEILESKDKFLDHYPFLDVDFKIIFIGGASIYYQVIPLCKTIWVTSIKKDYSCDLLFNYDYSKFTETLIEEDEELKIIQYTNF